MALSPVCSRVFFVWSFHIHLPASLCSTGFRQLHRYYRRSSPCVAGSSAKHEHPPESTQVYLLIAFDLPTIPSPTTALPFPDRRFDTLPQRDRSPRRFPGETDQVREFTRHAVEGSPLPSRLPDRLGRIEFVSYGLVFHLRLLSTPSHEDAVTFSYGLVTINPARTFTSLIKRLHRRTRPVSPKPAVRVA